VILPNFVAYLVPAIVVGRLLTNSADKLFELGQFVALLDAVVIFTYIFRTVLYIPRSIIF
jgi:hypothetical protein